MYNHARFQTANGVRIHTVIQGRPGPVMLFLHGFPECWLAWHRQLWEFSGDHLSVAVDLRGYNLSDKPREIASYALPCIVDDVRCLIQQLSPDRPVIVVGHDWGGMAAWRLAQQNPELIERLIIINAPHPALFYRELKRTPGQQLASSYALFFQWAGVSESFLRGFNFLGLRTMIFGTTVKPRMFPNELRQAYRAAWSQPGALTSSLNYYRNISALRKEAAAMANSEIEVPTLVLWGEKDPALLPGNLVGLEDYVLHLTIRRHRAATHWIIQEEPDWVNQAIREFLAVS